MWRKAGLPLAFLLGTLWLCSASAQEVSTPGLEDEALTGGPDPGPASEGPTEELTTDSPPSAEDGVQNTTEPDPPDTSDDGLETATLVGIIVGIIAAIGVATAVIIAVVKRASGQYS
nr:uncharacterized protein LOC132764909 [Anolis sagrei ordinatus]